MASITKCGLKLLGAATQHTRGTHVSCLRALCRLVEARELVVVIISCYTHLLDLGRRERMENWLIYKRKQDPFGLTLRLFIRKWSQSNLHKSCVWSRRRNTERRWAVPS